MVWGKLMDFNLDFNSVGKSASGSEKMSIGLFHFSSFFCKNIGESDSDRLLELEAVMREGYINTLLISSKETDFEGVIKLCQKYDCTIWFSAQKFFSTKQTIEEYIERIEPYVNKIKKLGADKLFKGFYWDEPFLNKITNDDFYIMTKTLFEKWGKRNFPVISFTPLIENNNFTGEHIKSEALKYVTDIAWDNYSYDLSVEAEDNAPQTKHLKTLHNIGFKTATEYYNWIHKLLMERLDHKVNVWHYPGVYSTWLYTERRCDEKGIIENLKYSNNLIAQSEHPCGLIMYNYVNSNKNPNEKGICSFLNLPDQNGEQLLYKDEKKWNEASALIKQLKKVYDNTYIKPVIDIKD